MELNAQYPLGFSTRNRQKGWNGRPHLGKETGQSRAPVAVQKEDSGRDWTTVEMKVAVERGPHKGSLVPGSMVYAHREARAKEEAGQ